MLQIKFSDIIDIQEIENKISKLIEDIYIRSRNNVCKNR